MNTVLFDLRGQYNLLREEIDAAVREVLASGEYILGPRVRLLEENLAACCGVPYGVGVASGSDALLLALLACGIGKGDEVITTPFTFFATAGTISRTGATPVFADIEPVTCNIDPEKISALISPRTRAIVPVHIFGQMADMDAVLDLARAHRLLVIEDACQALGAGNKGRKAGSLGHAGCFSFFPTKNLGGCGDGGMVVTRDPQVADRVMSLRTHGSRQKFIHHSVGCNSRLDEIQAAVLLVKLKYLDSWIEQRVALAGEYNRLLDGVVVTPGLLPGNRHTYHLYVVGSPQRDRIKEHLERNRVGCGVYYPVPLHLQQAFHHLGYREGDFPVAERSARDLLAIPAHPGLATAETGRIASLVREAAGLPVSLEK